MEETQPEEAPPKASAKPEISCRDCGAEPRARELLYWYQQGLWWTRSTHEQLLCESCFEALDKAEQREWIAVADLMVD